MKRSLLTILILGALALTSLPALPVSAEPPTLSAAPTALSATVELGSVVTLDLTITNTGSGSITPRLYTGFPPPPALSAMLAAPPSLIVPLPQQTEAIDPALQEELATGPTRFLVFMRQRPDLGDALLISDWKARGEYVYRALTTHAEHSQRAVRALLDAAGARYKVLWIVNALLVEGDAALAAALAARADVAMLAADHELQMAPVTTTTTVNCAPTAANVCWNIARIGADRVWREFGVTGDGITVASIDSGVQYNHPALVNQYRGNLGGGVFDHNYNWFDPLSGTTAPTASGSHGTHVMGTMVANPSDQPAMGVAPGARWIAARACSTFTCAQSEIIQAAQWMIAPTDLTGNHPRPDLRPHVLNNSWAFGAGGNPVYSGYTAAWQAAGIFTVFAVGNTSSNLTECRSVASPGDYADVVGVGATDQSDRVAYFSRIGPTTDNRVKPDLVAPGAGIWSTTPAASYGQLSGTSMAAPHVAGTVALLWSANPQLIGNYAATYALLTANAVPKTNDSAYMGTQHSECHPIGIPNNIYGYGRLDAFAAVAAARVVVPWLTLPDTEMATLASSGMVTLPVTLDARKVPGPGVYTARVLVYGNDLSDDPLIIPVTMTVPARPTHATISGVLRHAETNEPVAGTVTVTDGVSVQTSSAGAYSLIVPGGVSHTLTARAHSFAPKTVVITPDPGAAISLDITLDPQRPRLTLTPDTFAVTVDFNQTTTFTVPLRNDGNVPLTYTLAIDDEPYGVWRSDESDGPTGAWIDPPHDAQILNLGDDNSSNALDLGFDFPFDNSYYRSIYVGANGIIAFAPLPVTAPFSPSCLPLAETNQPAIIPLHVDFDSTLGGQISFARLSSGALITWDDVPLYGASRRLSAQALLQPNGIIRFHYRTIAQLQPDDMAAVGLQLTDVTQRIACAAASYPPLDLSDGLVIELRPQFNPRAWLSITDGGAGTVAVSEQTNAQLTARWIGGLHGVMQARVRIVSNDPLQPVQRARVQLSEGSPAPYRVWILMIYR